MSKGKSKSAPERVVTPLRAEDLDAVVALDRALGGLSRRGFFEKRLASALEEPGDFVYVGLRQGDRLIGYALARLAEGEFGRPGSAALLDAIGVDPAHQGESAGRTLLSAVEEVLRRKGVRQLTSQVEWERQDLLGFFAGAGFALAPRVVLTRATSRDVS